MGGRRGKAVIIDVRRSRYHCVNTTELRGRCSDLCVCVLLLGLEIGAAITLIPRVAYTQSTVWPVGDYFRGP